jgi:glutaminyl-tRNA synthetase
LRRGFERQGYERATRVRPPDHLAFNRTIGLRDTLAKEVDGKG